MEVLGTVGAFILVLVVLVLVHEVGHFVAAKLAGITVEEFGIGFPPRIASMRRGGTRYSLNWIPLGGFVKMLGEDGDVEVRRLREQGMSEPEIARAMEGAFNRKPVAVRLAVLLAGVAMNFLLAVVLFAAAFSVPLPYGRGPLTVNEIQAGSPADGNLRVGDVVVGVDGRTFDRSAELTEYLRERGGEPVRLEVVRDGDEIEVPVTPRELSEEDLARGVGPVGFGYRPEAIGEDPPIASGFLDAVSEGLTATWAIATQIPGGLADAVGGLLGLNPNAGDARGPIGIAQETGEMLESPLFDQLLFVGLLSVNLAVLNVLPFPPLDGGRIVVVVLEALRRRKLPPEREALIYLTGFAVLIALVILISIQDIQRLITGG
jgi:regulator of sigma E protease